MFEVYLVALLVLIGIGIATVSFWVQRSDGASWRDSVALPAVLTIVYSALVMFALTLFSDDAANGRHTECEASGVNESSLQVRVKNHAEFRSCTEIIQSFMEADGQLIRE